MPRQRDTGRRWPFSWRVHRRKAIGTVPLLDTISLTGFMTDPAEPELPPVSRTGSDVLGELPDWQGEQAATLPAGGARPDRPELGPATGEAADGTGWGAAESLELSASAAQASASPKAPL